MGDETDCTQCIAMILGSAKENNTQLRRCRKIALLNSLFCDKHQRWRGPTFTDINRTELKYESVGGEFTEILRRLDQQDIQQNKWRLEMNQLIESMTIQCDLNRELLQRIEILTVKTTVK